MFNTVESMIGSFYSVAMEILNEQSNYYAQKYPYYSSIQKEWLLELRNATDRYDLNDIRYWKSWILKNRGNRPEYCFWFLLETNNYQLAISNENKEQTRQDNHFDTTLRDGEQCPGAT